MENLHHYRKSYEKNKLDELDTDPDPMLQFRNWFSEAEAHPDIAEANAMSVSTLEADGCPRIRTVLLKSYAAEGFVFYTNYDSKKGKALEQNPLMGMLFFWPALERQVIIKARVARVPAEVSDAYFQERPRGSQLGACASPQSAVIKSREFLEKRLEDLENRMEGKKISRPENWGGYLATPYEIEFWQGRPNRLHDRILYHQNANAAWEISRLAP